MKDPFSPISDEDVRQIAQLVETLDNSEFDYIEVQVGELKVTLSKGDARPQVAAAAVPEYLPPLLVGCEKVEAGSVRVLAKTKPVPGVRLFRTDVVDDVLDKRVLAEITGLAKRKELLVALESARGFVKPLGQSAWLDWRGTDRFGQAPTLPSQLPEKLNKIWSAKLTGPAVAGPAANS